MVLACVGNSGSRHIPSKSNLTTTSPNSVSNLFESKHLYFASENGTTPPYARVYCAVWSISKPNGTLSNGLGLNAYQIVNKLISSVASCMFQTCKHIRSHLGTINRCTHTLTHAKTMLPKTRFFNTREAGRR